MLKKSVVLLSLLILLLTAGCSSETTDIKSAVNEYNQTLIRVLKTGSINLLNNVATDSEVSRMELSLNFLNEDNKILLADLQSLQFLSVNVQKPERNFIGSKKNTSQNKNNSKTDNKSKSSSNSNKESDPANVPKAEVKTKEIWNYKYINGSSGNVIDGPYKVMYNATYSLVKPKDRWVVCDIYFQQQITK